MKYSVVWEPRFDTTAKRKKHYQRHHMDGGYAFVINFGTNSFNYVGVATNKPIAEAKEWAQNQGSVVTIYALSGNGAELVPTKMATVKGR